MDTLTQAALGAAVGQSVYAHKLGRRANWYGAAAGLLPDLDVLARPLADEWQSLVWHRGMTHSIWFGPVAGTILGYCVWRFYERKRKAKGQASELPESNPLSAWIGLLTLGLLTHPLLDVFTTYGTQLLAPFTDTRFSLNAVGIVDPMYTGLLGFALLVGYRSRHRPKRARIYATVSLLLTTSYLFYGYQQNQVARQAAVSQLNAKSIKSDQIHVYPTLLQPWLRRIVVWSGPSVKVGFYSTIAPRKIQWVTMPHNRKNPRVKALIKSPRGRLFKWFANDQLVAEQPDEKHSRIRIHDFRYGMIGSERTSIWGFEGDVNPTTLDVSNVRRFRNRRMDMRQVIQAMWTSLTGSQSGGAQ